MYAIRSYYAYGTNPGMGTGITQSIPAVETIEESARGSYIKSLAYMGFEAGTPMIGKKVRITSYNVCYTKLLRGLEVECEFAVTNWNEKVIFKSKNFRKEDHQKYYQIELFPDDFFDEPSYLTVRNNFV